MSCDKKRSIIDEFLSGLNVEMTNTDEVFWFTVDLSRIAVSVSSNCERIRFHCYFDQMDTESYDSDSLHMANYISSLQDGPIFILEPEQCIPTLYNLYGVYNQEQLDKDFNDFCASCADFERFARSMPTTATMAQATMAQGNTKLSIISQSSDGQYSEQLKQRLINGQV